MAEPTEQDREKARVLLRHVSPEWDSIDVTIIAQALADERQARDEHWAKWHEEQRDGRLFQAAGWNNRGWPDVAAEHQDAARFHAESAATIRAKGEVK